MVYLLVLPIAFYAALATFVLSRRPRAISNDLVAAYTLLSAVITAAYLVLGTTPDRTLAGAAAWLIVVASGFHLLLLPLVILTSLYFEAWFRDRQRWLLSAGTAATLTIALLYQAGKAADVPLVYPVGDHAWIHWPLGVMFADWRTAVGQVLISQVLIAGMSAFLIYHRLMRLREAVSLIVLSVVSRLISILSPLAGTDALVMVAGLNFVPLVALITFLVVRKSRRLTLDRLVRTTLHSHHDGVVILDGKGNIVWRNNQSSRWLSDRGLNVLTSVQILDILRGTPLLQPIRHLLNSGETITESQIVHDGEEFVLQVELQYLSNLQQLIGARMLIFRDITASRMRRHLQDRSRELLALSAISVDIASILEPDQVIARALEQILVITRANSLLVYLLDEQDPLLLNLAGKRIAGDNVRALPDRYRIDSAPPASPINHVLNARTSLIIPDSDRSIYGPFFTEHGLQAGVLVPLLARDRSIGMLLVAYIEKHDFGQIEIALLESVARQVAVAIDNAFLHERERYQRRVAEVLREAAGLLGNMPQDQALETLLRLVRSVMDYDFATVLLVAEPGTVRVAAYEGFVADTTPDDLLQSRVKIDSFVYLKRLFDDRKPQLVSDTVADALWNPGPYNHGSWIGAPLIVHDQVVGCLSLSHHERGQFSEDDLQIAATFAAQVAIAAENTRLFENEQRRRVQAELMQQATYDLVTSPDLESALEAALINLAQMMPFDQAQIGLIDESSQTWLYRAGLPPVTEAAARIPLPVQSYPSVLRVIETRRPVMIADTREDSTWVPGRFSVREIRSWSGVPLLIRERIIGILNIDSFEPHAFSENSLQVAQVFANQIAAVLENFRLFSEASRQNRALSALNTVLAASNEALIHDDLPAVLLTRVLEALGLTQGTIHQYDNFAHELRLRAAVGLPEDVVSQLQRVPVLTTLSATTLPLVTDGQVYTFFSAPLFSHGVEIGLLSIRQDSGNPVGVDLKHLLVNIGHQVGVVMDNAMLFEETNRRAALSTDLSRLSLAIGALLDRDAVLDLLCRESVGIFDVQGAYVWLIENRRLVGQVAYGAGADWFAGHSIDLDDTSLLPARVIHEWRPRYINYMVDSPALPPDLLEMTRAQSVLAVPLLKAHVPIGTLMLVSTENPAAFADWLADQVGLLGVQAALAIQNATLFDEVRRRLDQLRLVNETGRYATAILNPQDLMEGVADKLSVTLGYDMVSLILVEGEQLSVRTIFFQNRPHAADSQPLLAEMLRQLARQAIERAEPVLVNQPGGKALVNEHGAGREHCTLAVPLIVADEVIGVLLVLRYRNSSITTEDLDVLEPLAAQLAISFQNARLFETVRQQALDLELRVIQRTAEIHQQQERTEAILRSVADAVIVFDLMGRVVMTNPVARALYDQYDLDMDLGRRVGELVARVFSAAEDVGDATDIIEVGSVTVQAKAARVVEGSEVLGAVVVLRDISRLQELDRMKDQFVSNVSHELRTPLANLKLYLSLLEQGRPERRASYYEVMQREIQRLTRLINDLLQISRLASEQRAERPRLRQRLDLEALIKTVIEDNTAWAESEHKELVAEYLTTPLPGTYGDPDQIVRALTNLMSNAISYTSEGGCITVRSHACPLEQTKPEWVIIEVADTGMGIPAAELSSIFERFYRGSNVSPTIPGTGLGLAIIKDIVRLHGGTIEAESQEGQGSTFRLKLPVLDS